MKTGAVLWMLCAALCASAMRAHARIPDTLAQRVAACTLCHGKEGVVGPDGYSPHRR
jgi:cytochrome c553